MNHQVILDKDTAEEIETFLRMLERAAATEADLLALRDAGLVEAAQVFADSLEMHLDEMRDSEEYGGGVPE